MKKNVLIIFLLLTGIGSVYPQKIPSLASLNPDYLSFCAKLENGTDPIQGTDAFGTGAMPPPGIISFDDYLKNNDLRSANFAPAYDMRSTGLLTPVREQTSGGCWAFATIASVESRWLVLGLGTCDLSENNLKYCHGFDPGRSYNGNHWMATAYFARRSGALIESDDPNSGGSPGPGQCPAGKIPVAYITDARYLPNDMNTIKQAILDQGAIYTMMYYVSSYYNTSNFTYYYSGAPQVNHAVDLVGWDDNKVTAGGTGAWICKNSYGTGWGEAGFFYVSYNDKGILNYNAYWPIRSGNIPNSKVYGYDDLGNYQSVGYGNPVGYSLVKFVADGKQLFSKVGTYAMTANATLEVDVFDNFDQATKTVSGLLSHQVGLSCPMPGYYTFDLPQPLILEQGNDFYIRIRYQTPSFNNPIPIERLISGYAAPFIESDVSWLSSDGSNGSWFAIGNSTANYKWDPCVKAYAESLLIWTGNTSNDWNDASNWSPSNIPASGINVIIPDVANEPVINQISSAPAVCNNLTIDAGSTVRVNSGKAITVEGTLTNNAGNTGLIIGSGASFIIAGVVNGPATVNSEITGGQWHLISSPITNAVSNIFYGKYLQEYTESTDTYLDIISGDEPLAVSSGYAVFNATDFVASYSGVLNTGEIGNLNNLSNEGSGWNLVGNPYPSYIDWDAEGWTKINVSDAIYLPVSSSSWASYVGGVGTNGGSRFIAPAQGYFVRVTGNSTGTLKMDNSIRVHNNALFFKNPIENLLRLKVSGNGYSDETVIRFLPEASAGFDDKFDALKLFGEQENAAQLYSVGSVPMSINSLPELNPVNIGIRANAGGVFSIAATEVNDLGILILEDIRTGTFTDLNSNSYTFTFNKGENEERFILHFNPSLINNIENSLLNIFSNSNIVHVNFNDKIKGDIFIYNISGQLITIMPEAQGNNIIRVANSGNYIVKVMTKNNVEVRKLWIQ